MHGLKVSMTRRRQYQTHNCSCQEHRANILNVPHIHDNQRSERTSHKQHTSDDRLAVYLHSQSRPSSCLRLAASFGFTAASPTSVSLSTGFIPKELKLIRLTCAGMKYLMTPQERLEDFLVGENLIFPAELLGKEG